MWEFFKLIIISYHLSAESSPLEKAILNHNMRKCVKNEELQSQEMTLTH